jgi:hypothetical protein
MPDQPPDSSNCRDQEQGNDHALIVVAVTGPGNLPLRPWMRPEGRASAPHDSLSTPRPLPPGQVTGRRHIHRDTRPGAIPSGFTSGPGRKESWPGAGGFLR